MLVHGLAQAYQGEPHTVSHCSNKDRLSPLPRLLRAAPASQAWSTATSIYALHTAALPCSQCCAPAVGPCSSTLAAAASFRQCHVQAQKSTPAGHHGTTPVATCRRIKSHKYLPSTHVERLVLRLGAGAGAGAGWRSPPQAPRPPHL